MMKGQTSRGGRIWTTIGGFTGLLVLDHTGLIGYSFFHTPLVEGRSHAQTQSIRGDADRNGALVPA